MDNQSSEIKNLLKKANKDYDQNLSKLKSLNWNENLEKKQQILHTEVFQKIDCLDCGNCCKTTPTTVNSKDIKRISKYLGISKKEFIRKYVMDDLTGDLVLNFVPCTFLNEDNTCSIYEVRPITCIKYPLTDDSEFKRRAKWNAVNTMVCPASLLVVEGL